jgi:hypothetical protein
MAPAPRFVARNVMPQTGLGAGCRWISVPFAKLPLVLCRRRERNVIWLVLARE